MTKRMTIAGKFILVSDMRMVPLETNGKYQVRIDRFEVPADMKDLCRGNEAPEADTPFTCLPTKGRLAWSGHESMWGVSLFCFCLVFRKKFSQYLLEFLLCYCKSLVTGGPTK